MRKALELEGQRFGSLTAVERTRDARGEVAWVCSCDCGNQVTIKTAALRNGNTKSCGCLKIQKLVERSTKHGLRYTTEYLSWQHAKKRCFDKNNNSYHDYGERGITMCAEWVNDFPAFYAYIGPKPDDGQKWSLGRIDNNGNYEPGNVRWETDEQQARNHRLVATNKTGVCGVARKTQKKRGREYYAYVATIGGLKEIKQRKEFSVKKHGEEEAFRLACEWREQKLKELEQKGIVYAESHGK